MLLQRRGSNPVIRQLGCQEPTLSVFSIIGLERANSLRRSGFRGSASSCGLVQRHGGANERLQRLFIDLVALMEIDGTPGVAFEAGVEEAARVLERGVLGEGQLHDGLVRLAGADDAGVLPEPLASSSTAFSISPPRPHRGRPA
jgi:hypothetical protein